MKVRRLDGIAQLRRQLARLGAVTRCLVAHGRPFNKIQFFVQCASLSVHATLFKQFRRTPLEATVAIPLVLNFFFVAIMVMLTFSNGIIAYGALFSRRESVYLMTSPLTALDVVTMAFVKVNRRNIGPDSPGPLEEGLNLFEHKIAALQTNIKKVFDI